MPVTDQQARAIAFLAAAARPSGARRWDEAGILAAVKKVADRSLSTVVIAVMQAAEDRGAHTPGVIPTPGPHWRAPDARTPAPAPVDPARSCAVCSLPADACRVRWSKDHDFTSLVTRRQARPAPLPARIRNALKGHTEENDGADVEQ